MSKILSVLVMKEYISRGEILYLQVSISWLHTRPLPNIGHTTLRPHHHRPLLHTKLDSNIRIAIEKDQNKRTQVQSYADSKNK